MAMALVLALGVATVANPGLAQQANEITTDTMEYCSRLATEVARAPDRSAQTSELLAEGRDMCQRGHVRGGIIRLRRAMIVARESGMAQPSPPP